MSATGDGAAQSGVPAAWYACPGDARLLRWWDGRGWTGHTVDPRTDDAASAQATEPPSPTPPTPPSTLAPSRSTTGRLPRRTRGRAPATGPVLARSTYATVDAPTVRKRSGPLEPRGRLLAGALLLVIAVSVAVLLAAIAAITDRPQYQRSPWPIASTEQLTVTDRQRLLTPEGMSEQILTDLRTDGSVVTGATCPSDATTEDSDILTCRVDMQSASADVRVQVTDGYSNVAFVILGFDYD